MILSSLHAVHCISGIRNKIYNKAVLSCINLLKRNILIERTVYRRVKQDAREVSFRVLDYTRSAHEI